ncbi:MAG: hypothetical protein H6Q26_3190 [Bacteroidetes bacterium]|uniref:hypothetical protein n=1 Tax=unclassified Chitinophaga TaxID=2619133 RepID=UPI0009D14208|nr:MULTISPECIES: hypothetical protein [unclassified Chitinophaga]MBP1653033.1 hypothetical protein [Bacteroidota bacterium]OMP77643.1 hypothetical protein BW716_18945 [[Flexibacter] sp. ATCC 35208]WPV68179.1 hypothetical protein QQL36_05540 [Chitinophaga sp. LS1]
MRSIFTWLLLLTFFCSCEKNDTEATPSIDVTGSWELAASMKQPDTTWQAVAAADSATYSFDANGQVSYSTKSWRTTGTYKVIADGSKVKLIISTDSLSQYLEVEKTSDSTIRVDDWLKAVNKGYTSKRFVRVF